MGKISKLKVFISAGEASGDYLGAQIFGALKQKKIKLTAAGITGPKMEAAGISSWYNISQLSVMGFSAVLNHLAKIKIIQNNLLIQIERFSPDVVILIDYQSFNLTLGEQIKLRQIPTILCVAPQVWAWRQERAYYLKEKVDLILGILPFEENFFKQFNVPFKYIGSPILDRIKNIPLSSKCIQKHPSVAMFPGSRKDEFKYVFPYMWKIGKSLAQKNISVRINIAPSLRLDKISDILIKENLNVQEMFFALKTKGIFSLNNITFEKQNSLQTMKEVDFALVTSGTATLECALVGTPLAVIYVSSKLNYFIAKKLVKCPYISLPNLIFQKKVIEEFVQNINCTSIEKHILKFITGKEHIRLKQDLLSLHSILKNDASSNAAKEILNYVHSKK